MVQESFNHQIKHLVSMQYSTVALRHKALEDVLDGPGRLHDDLPTKLAEVREFVKPFTDARLEIDRDAFPPVRRTKPPRISPGSRNSWRLTRRRRVRSPVTCSAGSRRSPD